MVKLNKDGSPRKRRIVASGLTRMSGGRRVNKAIELAGYTSAEIQWQYPLIKVKEEYMLAPMLKALADCDVIAELDLDEKLTISVLRVLKEAEVKHAKYLARMAARRKWGDDV